MPPPPAPHELAGPVSPPERIASLDVLRGVALLGILLLNVASFSMPQPAYLAPTLGGGPLTGGNYAVWVAQRIVGDQRFMSIFAMLFGAGVCISTGRYASRGADVARLHYRRMTGLLAIGLLHGYLLWYGDVLVSYAVIAMLVFVLRDRPPRQLAWLAAGLIGVGWLLALPSAADTWAAAREDPSRYENWIGADAFDLTAETADYRGGYADELRRRVGQTINEEMFSVVIYGPRIAGLMLLGMAFYKRGLLDGRSPAGPSLKLAAAGFAVGLPLAALDLWQWHAHDFGLVWAWSGAMLLNYWASIFIALAYVGLIVPLSARLPSILTAPFAAVGRTALSNYLLQTALCTTLFYGYGLGHFGTFNRVQQAAVVAGIWLIELIVSPLWLAGFRFGPVEWAWRSVTYGRIQPIVNRRRGG